MVVTVFSERKIVSIPKTVLETGSKFKNGGWG